MDADKWLSQTVSAGCTLLSPAHIAFRTRPVLAYESNGTPRVRWASYGMPILGKYANLIDATVFLYKDAADAKAGVRSGGTGFIVGMHIPNHDRIHAYCITNWHVACRGFATVRLNGKDGQPPDAIEHDPSEWTFIPGGPDIAAIPIRLDQTKQAVSILDARSFLISRDFVKEQSIGPGEDVFMVGRFLDYEGVEVNTPSLRFGHISIMDAKVRQETGYMGQSIVADMHCRTGYSGSPVFVYRTTGSGFLERGEMSFGHTMIVLGILWGQFPEMWELESKQKTGDATATAGLITEGQYVKGLSGMSCLCPAWDIMDVLNTPRLVQQRAEQEAILDQLFPKGGGAPLSMVAGIAK